MHVTLGFYDDVIIPPHGMPEPTFWHETDQVRLGLCLGTLGSALALAAFVSTAACQHSTTMVMRCLLRRQQHHAPNMSLPMSQAWIWRVEGNDLFFEKGLEVRFKVQGINFYPVPTLAEQREQREKGEEVRLSLWLLPGPRVGGLGD